LTFIVELTVPDGWPIHLTWAAMALGIMAWGRAIAGEQETRRPRIAISGVTTMNAILNAATGPIVLIMRRSGLLTEDLDYRLMRASMVMAQRTAASSDKLVGSCLSPLRTASLPIYVRAVTNPSRGAY
jgi:hypothetical protein